MDKSGHGKRGGVMSHTRRLDDMLAMLEEIRECAYCWSDYEVPVGIVERLDEVIKKARGEE